MEESLISKLEAGDSGVYALFAEYLSPFSDLSNNTIVSLVSRFNPFIQRTAQIIFPWFKKPSKFNGKEEIALELFHIFRLCIDCLQVVSSCVSWNPSAYRKNRVIFLVEIVGHAAKAQSKHVSYYIKVLRLVEEATPWFRLATIFLLVHILILLVIYHFVFSTFIAKSKRRTGCTVNFEI